MTRLVFSAVLFLTMVCRAHGATAPSPTCAPAAFATIESGKVAAVDWIERDGNRVHTRSLLTQSNVIDATIDLRPDQTAAHASVIVNAAGVEPSKPNVRDLGHDAIYWSDMIASSVEQAIARAQVLRQPSSRIVAASLFSDSRGEVLVERLDATDWVVSYHNKRYEVLTDERGCMLSATLPEFGVTIERRTAFSADNYPLWPAYAAPPDGAYHASEVSIPAPQGHVLAGTLTTPLNQQRVPVAVLITGLSPHERNNGQPPWMPLRDIADALTRSGIAVLRVDDRGVGKSTGDHDSMVVSDKVDDVRTELSWLRSRPEIDPKRIALVGYSEGGLIASMVASSDPTIAAVATLAGPGVPGPVLARYQIEQAVMHDPAVPTAEREKEVARRLAEKLTPHERTYLAIDPLQFARRVHCPALIIQGGTDKHVPVRSAQRIATAMRTGGNSDVTVRIFPGISHSLLPDPMGLGDGWVFLPGFLTEPKLLDVLTHWAATKLVTRSER
jgi:hypothetical protein